MGTSLTTTNDKIARSHAHIQPVSPGTVQTVFEMLLLAAGSTSVFALILNGRSTANGLIAAAVVLLAAAQWSRRSTTANRTLAGIVRALATLGAAIWLFCWLRQIGWAAWPLIRPADTREYLASLYMQFVLAATIGVAALWAMPRGADHFLRWGRWRKSGLALVFVLALIACFGLAAWLSIANRPVLAGPIIAIGVIAATKAALFALTEEVVYRGVLLSAGAVHWGAGWAIVFQAAVFAAFHAFVSPAFTPGYLFIAAVFLLGIVLGWVSFRTGGIGWAWCCHSALALSIEWQNIS